MKILKIILSLYLLSCGQVSYGQIYSSTRLSDLPRRLCSLSNNFRRQGPIVRYRLSYRTANQFGKPITATGLVAFRRNHLATLTPVMFLHPTPNSKDGVPSYGTFTSRYAACKVLANHNVMIAPDYHGLGGGEGYHPYMIREATDQANIDFLNAVDHWLVSQRIMLKNNLLVAGYSQGGHAALSLHQYIENHPTKWQIHRTYAMSAPTNLSEDLLNDILNGRSNKNSSFFTALILANYNVYYGNLFGESPYRANYRHADYLALSMNKKGLRKLLPINPRNALHPNFLVGLRSNLDHQLRLHLKKNDIMPWYARAPIVLNYSGGDETIKPNSTFKFFNKMRSLGNNIRLVRSSPNQGHTPHFLRSIKFLANEIR